MVFIDERTGLELMDQIECLRLLETKEIGRLGVIVHGHPVVLPVNYALDGDNVVFRTDPGTKLDAAQRSLVCFEVDEIDHENHAGWSVLVHGIAEEVAAPDRGRFERLGRLPIDPWTGGEKAHLVRIIPRVITGRRIRS